MLRLEHVKKQIGVAAGRNRKFWDSNKHVTPIVNDWIFLQPEYLPFLGKQCRSTQLLVSALHQLLRRILNFPFIVLGARLT